MELYADLVPLTAENFRALYTKKPLHYKGLCLSQHYPRIHVEGRRLRQGPWHRRRVHLRRHLPNENFLLPHDRPWLPNGSAENNISQFFTRVPWFDGNYVVFGCIISGFHNLKAIEAEVEVKIANRGEVVIVPPPSLTTN
ncbi:peptidyl-prolyl cis-trans isomerase B [Oryza sativa Japonica Group]|uniref:Peptidyl-prolyl cis-trans isomerase n=2 Tax=Oryza sativa subsp. japonica TaxID=39947 RepID=A0A0P0VDS1_ORYSJ|nr:peptidyl-prolyl cis-trans isomerase B [Oryza sativa Japonica Group]EAZ21465.1 hypothetical protein OsJ_05067 [Oryza sativa Japonica Group]KAF2942614.1 hypothetical protein DAI22_02g009200 [Oryza sativa Japonica Group]BAD07844.1 hypothetical protein [Oryza sativa Japonica Group]BAS76618.1 Os02g0111200 [Oryza sativa Japonica Group]